MPVTIKAVRRQTSEGVKPIRDPATDAYRRHIREGADFVQAFYEDEKRSRQELRKAASKLGGRLRTY